MKSILTPNAPAPAGHYSQAIVHNGIVYLSGQLPIDPRTGSKTVGSIESQTEQVIQNVDEILKAAGSGLDQILKVTIYISDVSLWGAVNTVYSRLLGPHRPARVVVPTKDLHYGFQIEMEAIAVAEE